MKADAAITPCLFCHSERVEVVNTSMALGDDVTFDGDMAECLDCHASAQLELWQRMVAFMKPIRDCLIEVLSEVVDEQ